MRMTVMLLVLCLLTARCVTSEVANEASQETNTTQEYVHIDCCQMLCVLKSYTVQSTGDKCDLQSLQSCLSHECLTLQVVQLFINHTRSMLDSSSSLGSSKRKMLVLALLGRAALPSALLEEHMSIEYNDALDVLSQRDSHCSTDKTIYSTIVIASISLLVFFIATQVVESETRKQTETRSAPCADAIVSTKTQANMRLLRMHVNH